MSADISWLKDFNPKKLKRGRKSIMTTVKMLIIIFMHKSSVILSDDPVTMRVYLRSKTLITHKNTSIKILPQQV